MSQSLGCRLGIDVGGTFTDFVLVNERTGGICREKCLTTPDDPVRGIMEGFTRLRNSGALVVENLRGVAHATTLVTNTLIERKGAPTALVTTRGFRDVLELGADTRYDMYDLDIDFPKTLVEREFRIEINERVNAEGETLVAPDLDELRRKLDEITGKGIRSIAVCFLHSYRNPTHERDVAIFIRDNYPEFDVSVSSTVAPEIREYERSMTVCANAYVKPIVRSYLSRLSGAFSNINVDTPILVMLSNGGMTTLSTASEVPIWLIESGPAAGVLSACFAGIRMRNENLIAFDMGGTTAKACFIDNGEPAFTGTFEAARVKRQFRGSGLPLKVPSVEMIEIGAGGGSLATVSQTGLLKVGPHSAGANPGPICYGRGGKNATVTDADLVLGYLDPQYFLGGDMSLNLKETEAAITALGQSCGMGLHATAAGIAEIVNQNMATAIRIHAAERGKDYRNYGLFAFGGAGPVHAYEVARILRLTSVIFPLGAGTNSAFGLLAAPVAVDLSRSYNSDIERADWNYVNTLYEEMEIEARQILADAGVDSPTLTRAAELRFVGQGFELRAPIPMGHLSAASVSEVTRAFHAQYQKIYETVPGALPMESLTWRLRATGPAPNVSLDAQQEVQAVKMRGRRLVYFPEVKAFIETPVYNRYALQPENTIIGPAVVEERESTAIIGPSGRGTIDTNLNLVVDIDLKKNADLSPPHA
jgi:N-methylhydantoinase A